jgi:hypothetical protein
VQCEIPGYVKKIYKNAFYEGIFWFAKQGQKLDLELLHGFMGAPIKSFSKAMHIAQ